MSPDRCSVLETVREELHRLEALNKGSTDQFASLRIVFWRHERAFRTVLLPLLASQAATRDRALRVSDELDALRAQFDAVDSDVEGIRTQLRRYLNETLSGVLEISRGAYAAADEADLVKRYQLARLRIVHKEPGATDGAKATEPPSATRHKR